MINLKLFTTKYKTYSELSENEKDLNYYNNIFHNEIIWIDGLVINNAKFDAGNKIILFDNKEKNAKQKMNLVGVSYIIQKWEEREDIPDYEEKSNNEEVNEGEENEEESEEESEEENEENKENKENNNKKENKKHIENENENETIKKKIIRVNIVSNESKCMFNKYYQDDNLGFIEFKILENDVIDQNYIYENDVKITIEDLNDFTDNKK